MKHKCIALVLAVSLFFVLNLQAQIKPLPHGHAHNDYVHHKPLLDALENGFTSIEVDVFLHKGELRVAHVGIGLDTQPTIEQLYLEPVSKIIEANGGNVYKGHQVPVIFMIDFKTAGIETYAKLKEVLAKYSRYLTVYKGDSVIRQGAINILISGASPIGELLKADSAFATVDGALRDIDNAANRKVITRYSDPWQRYFNWRGKGKMPAAQKQKLDSLVAKVHALNKQIRFYHIPDKPAVWRALLNAGVDWVNTDKLEAYNTFYNNYNAAWKGHAVF